MGTTTLEQRAPYVEHFRLALLLPRLLVFGQMSLIGGFGIVIMGMGGLMRPSEAANPFMAYADVFPGQSTNAIAAHGFSCPMQSLNYFREMSEMYCRKTSKTAPFDSVDVIYSSGIIRRLSFEIRDGTFTVGDVALLLNVTEIRYYRGVLFNWRNHFAHAQLVNANGHFSMLTHVSQVTLTDAPMFRP